jgi:hypothetical protein
MHLTTSDPIDDWGLPNDALLTSTRGKESKSCQDLWEIGRRNSGDDGGYSTAVSLLWATDRMYSTRRTGVHGGREDALLAPSRYKRSLRSLDFGDVRHAVVTSEKVRGTTERNGFGSCPSTFPPIALWAPPNSNVAISRHSGQSDFLYASTGHHDDSGLCVVAYPRAGSYIHAQLNSRSAVRGVCIDKRV